MEKLTAFIDGISAKTRDTFFVNLIIGFIITNYKFLYVLSHQEIDTSVSVNIATTADIVEYAKKFLHPCWAILYAVVITFAYPLFSMVVIKWKETTKHWKEKWLDASYPSNDQYQKKLAEITELKSKANESALALARAMVEECSRNFNREITLFSYLTAAPDCHFNAGDYAVIKNIDNNYKLKPVSTYQKGDSGNIRYIYCKINDNLFVVSNVDQFSIQPESLLNGTAEFLVLMISKGVVLCSKNEFEAAYAIDAHDIIFSIKKEKNFRYSKVSWHE